MSLPVYKTKSQAEHRYVKVLSFILRHRLNSKYAGAYGQPR